MPPAAWGEASCGTVRVRYERASARWRVGISTTHSVGRLLFFSRVPGGKPPGYLAMTSYGGRLLRVRAGEGGVAFFCFELKLKCTDKNADGNRLLLGGEALATRLPCHASYGGSVGGVPPAVARRVVAEVSINIDFKSVED